MRRIIRTVAAGAALALVAAGCGSSGGSSGGSSSGASAAPKLTKVKLQLQWFTQAQFGGYYAALDQGFFKQQGLDVQIIEGGTDIVPQTVLAQGQADFAVAWVPKALASREQGAQITDVGQVFQRSDTLQVSLKDKGITSAAALKDKKVGDWGFGNEYELFAGMTKAGLDPSKDAKFVQQQFDEQALLKGDIDAAQAMRYNEYAQILEAKNPKTGKLYQPSDLNVLDWQAQGTGMLQDAVWASTPKLQSDKTYQDTTTKFLTAAYQGWAFCRDNVQKCRDIVVAKGSKLGATHQLWEMNEINKMVWPATAGVGMVNAADWDRTVTIAQGTKNAEGKTVLTKKPEGLAYTNDYTVKALAALKAKGVDTTGASFKPITVTLTAGGV